MYRFHFNFDGVIFIISCIGARQTGVNVYFYFKTCLDPCFFEIRKSIEGLFGFGPEHSVTMQNNKIIIIYVTVRP